MMVTSDRTALIAMSTVEKTGKLTATSVPPLEAGERRARLPPAIRPSTMNAITGNAIVPKAPIGSRRKILISSQVNFSKPRTASPPSVANRVARQLQEHVFEVWSAGPEVGHPDPMLGQARDDFGHQIVAAAANRDPIVVSGHFVHARHRAKPIVRRSVRSHEHDASLGAVPIHEAS